MAEKEKQTGEDVGDDNLVESDNDNVMDNLNVLEDDTRGEDSTVVPKVGMKFKDENEMFDFYKRYVYHVHNGLHTVTQPAQYLNFFQPSSTGVVVNSQVLNPMSNFYQLVPDEDGTNISIPDLGNR